MSFTPITLIFQGLLYWYTTIFHIFSMSSWKCKILCLNCLTVNIVDSNSAVYVMYESQNSIINDCYIFSWLDNTGSTVCIMEQIHLILLLLQVVENLLRRQQQAQEQVKQARTSYYSLLLRKQQEEKDLKENLENSEDQVYLYLDIYHLFKWIGKRISRWLQ